MDIKLFQPEEPVSRKAANERLTAINDAGAADIPYDNTTSKMDADNVQRAIDLTAQSAKEAVDKINQLIGNDGIVNLTVTLSTGKPASKLPLKVVSGAQTETVTTSVAGKATITINGGGSVTVKYDSAYADLASASKTITAASGAIVSDSMTVTLKNYIEVTSSQSVQFSTLCTRVDVCCGGAGGGGCTGDYDYNLATRVMRSTQSGGGGGYVTTQENISFTAGKSYQATIGQGGAGDYAKGASGGTTSFTTDGATVSASGGSGASRSVYSKGASGNGVGGLSANPDTAATSGGAGTSNRYNGFSTTCSYGGGGGGNGMWGKYTDGYNSAAKSGKSGGSPSGGGGGSYSKGGGNATGYGGGGGGGGRYIDYDDSPGGDGYQGIVCLRMWHGEEGA